MKKKEKTKKLVEAIIQLKIKEHDLIKAMDTARILCERSLNYNEWRQAYLTMGYKKIVDTLKIINDPEQSVLFIAYLKKGEDIKELISAAEHLNNAKTQINPDDLNEIVQRLIKDEAPKAEIQILTAVKYLNGEFPDLSKRWLRAGCKIALRNNNVAAAIQINEILDEKLTEEQIEGMLLYHIKKMMANDVEEQKTHLKNEVIELIELLPSEKQIYENLIF